MKNKYKITMQKSFEYDGKITKRYDVYVSDKVTKLFFVFMVLFTFVFLGTGCFFVKLPIILIGFGIVVLTLLYLLYLNLGKWSFMSCFNTKELAEKYIKFKKSEE